jgi:imidazolonepropionase-like amidohydrolase
MATLGAARVMRRHGRTGSIAPGKDADLVLVDGDPLARISDVRRVVRIIKDGFVFDSNAVHASVGVRPR